MNGDLTKKFLTTTIIWTLFFLCHLCTFKLSLSISNIFIRFDGNCVYASHKSIFHASQNTLKESCEGNIVYQGNTHEKKNFILIMWWFHTQTHYFILWVASILYTLIMPTRNDNNNNTNFPIYINMYIHHIRIAWQMCEKLRFA